MSETGLGKVARFRLTALAAQARVRELAKDSGNLHWSRHIRERMPRRGIDSEDVLRILRTGNVEDDPRPGDRQGEWVIKIVRKMGNGRVAGVVTVLIHEQALRLLTAEWEDHR